MDKPNMLFYALLNKLPKFKRNLELVIQNNNVIRILF